MTREAYIGGVGVNTRGWPEDFGLVGALQPTEFSLLPSGARRRASALTRAMADAYSQAVQASGCDPTRVATVFASAWGETAILMELLEQVAAGEAELSPIRFAGSVHNAASGQVSIAAGNRSFTTSLAAGDDTVAMALQEAIGLLATGWAEVVVVFGDLDPPTELAAAEERCEPLAVSLHIHNGTGGRSRLAALGPLRVAQLPVQMVTSTALQANPMAGALELALAVTRGRFGRVGLGNHRGGAWTVEIGSSQGGLPPLVELLPHRGQMILLDEVIGWDGEVAHCRVVITEGRPFVTATGAETVVVIEYMAQCVAAWVALSGRERGEPVQIGYLLGCRELRMQRDRLPVGLRLDVTARRVWGNDALGSFTCEVRDAEGLVSEATLSVARPDGTVAI